ncbi:hypothetical protein DFH27DRAFT_600226 [Peziza echinospora]|nr:hypothetical protein DFH27DRAFT_600226 [Peziza echinospora]
MARSKTRSVASSHRNPLSPATHSAENKENILPIAVQEHWGTKDRLRPRPKESEEKQKIRLTATKSATRSLSSKRSRRKSIRVTNAPVVPLPQTPPPRPAQVSANHRRALRSGSALPTPVMTAADRTAYANHTNVNNIADNNIFGAGHAVRHARRNQVSLLISTPVHRTTPTTTTTTTTSPSEPATSTPANTEMENNSENDVSRTHALPPTRRALSQTETNNIPDFNKANDMYTKVVNEGLGALQNDDIFQKAKAAEMESHIRAIQRDRQSNGSRVALGEIDVHIDMSAHRVIKYGENRKNDPATPRPSTPFQKLKALGFIPKLDLEEFVNQSEDDGQEGMMGAVKTASIENQKTSQRFTIATAAASSKISAAATSAFQVYVDQDEEGDTTMAGDENSPAPARRYFIPSPIAQQQTNGWEGHWKTE